MREIVHLQAGQCGNQIGGKVILKNCLIISLVTKVYKIKMAIPRCQTFLAIWQAVAIGVYIGSNHLITELTWTENWHELIDIRSE